MQAPVLFESHCHTPLCRHSVGEPEEYAQAALDRNMAGITITCHGPTPIEWGHCMRQSEWAEYLDICERARVEYAGQIEVKTGIECDYLPSLVSYWRDFLPKNPFLSHVLGSVHPQVSTYREQNWHGDAFDYQKVYFKHLADAAETGLFDTLSHPDLVKNTTPSDWNIERIMPHIQRQLDRIAKAGTAMELNTSGLYKSIKEMNPAPQILREMASRGIPVVIGSDAHVPERVGDKWEDALDLLSKCGFEKVSFFVERKRRDVEIEVAKASLNPAQASHPFG
ncbi:histidinol-phosphatase HisJ family protein [bacterium]|nr:MAG: histidinol-phosphatase HisJ family protein [bacterium]